jgi:S-formylglutathione hydrolase FrmB
MNVILPQNVGKGMIGMKETGAGSAPPVLYLLHGMSDDHTIWLRRTSIERYAAPLGLAVVMPAVHRSYYTDMHEGGAYWTFVSEELPRIVESLFKVSADPRDRFVAGLSMGGYGAAKLALRKPDFFAAAASLSGAMDIHDIHRFYKDPERMKEWLRVFGPPERIAGSENDLFHLASELAAKGGPFPKLFQCCGTEDFLYKQNTSFRDHLRTLEYPDFTYEESPGIHEWGYWDRMIQRVLEWLPLGANAR